MKVSAPLLIASTLLITLAILGFPLAPPVHGATTSPIPVLDASASSNCTCGHQTITVPVHQTSEILIISIGANPQSVYQSNGNVLTASCSLSGGGTCLTSITSPQCTFQLHSSYTQNPNSGDGQFWWEEWCSVSQPGAVQVTVNVAASNLAWTIVGASYAGANTVNPFQSGIQILTSGAAGNNPDFNDCNPAGSDSCSIVFSTTNPNVLGISFIISQGCPSVQAPGVNTNAVIDGHTIINSSVGPSTLITDTCVPFGAFNAMAYVGIPSVVSNAQTGGWCLSVPNQSPCSGESGVWAFDGIVACTAGSNNCSPAISTSSTTSSSSSSSTTSSNTSCNPAFAGCVTGTTTSTSSTIVCSDCTPPSGPTTGDWIVLAIIAVIAGYLVYLKTHKPRRSTR